MSEILAIIPARGGSKGIQMKNIYPLVDKPLLAYTVEAVNKSQLISRCILSTENKKIADIGTKLGVEVPFLRPERLAKDDTPTIDVIQHIINKLAKEEKYFPDTVMILQPTSPLRTAHHIDEAIKLYNKMKADSLVSIIEVPHQYNPYSIMQMENGYLKPFLKYPERDNLRQKKPIYYARNGAAIYIVDRQVLMEQNTLFGEKILPYKMDKYSSIDIDDMLDLKIAEYLLKNMTINKN